MGLFGDTNRLVFFPLLIGLMFSTCKRHAKSHLIPANDVAKKLLAEALADSADILPVDSALIDTEEMAVKFAEVVLFKVYSREQIEQEQPYELCLQDGYWIIHGSLPEGADGGTFEMIFKARNGQIVRLTHYK